MLLQDLHASPCISLSEFLVHFGDFGNFRSFSSETSQSAAAGVGRVRMLRTGPPPSSSLLLLLCFTLRNPPQLPCQQAA